MASRRSHPQVRTLLLDFGNVIAPFSYERFFERCAECLLLSASELQSILFDSGMSDRFQSGEMNPTAFVAEFCHRAKFKSGKSIDYKTFASWWIDIFTFSATEELRLSNLLDRIDKASTSIGLVSNTDAIMYVRCMHIHPTIQRHIPYHRHTLSYKVGARKPDRAIYDDAIRRSGATYDTALLVDDIPENIAAFSALGGHGILWNASVQTINDLEGELGTYNIFSS